MCIYIYKLCKTYLYTYYITFNILYTFINQSIIKSFQWKAGIAMVKPGCVPWLKSLEGWVKFNWNSPRKIGNITWGGNPQKWLFTIQQQENVENGDNPIDLGMSCFQEKKQHMVLPNDLLHQLLKVSCRCSLQPMFVHMQQAISFIYNLNLHESLHCLDSMMYHRTPDSIQPLVHHHPLYQSCSSASIPLLSDTPKYLTIVSG